MKMCVNGVPVAPHGLILGENEATPSRKLFKHLPGPPGPVFGLIIRDAHELGLLGL